MLEFILGTFLGALLMLGALFAGRPLNTILERYNKTGRVTKGKPIIIEGDDPVQAFIDKTFELKE